MSGFGAYSEGKADGIFWQTRSWAERRGFRVVAVTGGEGGGSPSAGMGKAVWGSFEGMRIWTYRA